MDPNATLDKIRECTRKLQDPTFTVQFLRDFVTDDLVEAVGDLDEWIKRGGFLPDAWRVEQL